MKIGVDAVILGSWANVSDAKKVLDLGAGSGVISLMLAQRFFNIKIDAIEINDNAVKDLQLNFDNSEWSNRLNIIHEDFLKYNFENNYDLIISNPPFFKSTKSEINKGREQARIATTLSPDVLCDKAYKILSSKGKLIVVFPYSQRKEFVISALVQGFYLYSELSVLDTENTVPKRSILCFSKAKPSIVQSNILILKKSDGSYTDSFSELTKDFYL